MELFAHYMRQQWQTFGGDTQRFKNDTTMNTGVGLLDLTWDTSAPNGFTNSGRATISAEWWTGDPLTGGSFIMNALG
jgi:hypothetical protein